MQLGKQGNNCVRLKMEKARHENVLGFTCVSADAPSGPNVCSFFQRWECIGSAAAEEGNAAAIGAVAQQFTGPDSSQGGILQAGPRRLASQKAALPARAGCSLCPSDSWRRRAGREFDRVP